MFAMSALTAPDPPCEDRTGHAQVVEQDRERPGLLDRAQVLADDVLDQRELQRPCLVERGATSAGIVASPAIAAARQRRLRR